MARDVAEHVRARLTADERSRLGPGPPVNPESHDAYLKGRLHSQKLTREDLETAQRYFESALEKDRNSALGYAGLAGVWGVRELLGLATPREAGAKAAEAVERALALNGELVQAARMKAFTHWDFPGAEAEFRRAIELSPSYAGARVLYARLLDYLRRSGEARPHLARALQVDPHSAYVRAM